MGSNRKEYVKNLFQGVVSVILCKRYVSGNVKKICVTKYAKFNEFRTVIGLKEIFQSKSFTCKGKVKYLRHH